MVVTICILSFLLLLSICLNIFLWVLMTDYLTDNPQIAVDHYFKQETVEKFPCTLLLTINDSADFDGSAYDFSQYEEKNIIGLIECKKGATKDDDDDDEPQIALIPGQIVCKMKDGSFQWDFRGLM